MLEALGAAEEYRRIMAHIELAQTSGAWDLAHAAIRAGQPVTDEIFDQHLVATRNKSDVAIRQAESDAAAAAVDGTAPTSEDESFGSQVVQRMRAARASQTP